MGPAPYYPFPLSTRSANDHTTPSISIQTFKGHCAPNEGLWMENFASLVKRKPERGFLAVKEEPCQCYRAGLQYRYG